MNEQRDLFIFAGIALVAGWYFVAGVAIILALASD
jgi:hypothetical protein